MLQGSAEMQFPDFAAEDEQRYGSSWQEVSALLLRETRPAPVWTERQNLLYFVRENAAKTDPRVVKTLRQVAKKDPNPNIRSLAADILISVDLQSIPEQIWRLNDPNWSHRKDALTSLEHQSEADNDPVLTSFAMSLMDPSAAVRGTAIESLVKVAQRRDPDQVLPHHVLLCLMDRLDDSDVRVRGLAVDGIVEVAVAGDADLVQVLVQRMQADKSSTRKAAGDVMCRLAIKFQEATESSLRTNNPDASPLLQIEKLLLHDDVKVQRVAIGSMEQISKASYSLYNAEEAVLEANVEAIQERQNRDMGQANLPKQSEVDAERRLRTPEPVVPVAIRRAESAASSARGS